MVCTCINMQYSTLSAAVRYFFFQYNKHIFFKTFTICKKTEMRTKQKYTLDKV